MAHLGIWKYFYLILTVPGHHTLVPAAEKNPSTDIGLLLGRAKLACLHQHPQHTPNTAQGPLHGVRASKMPWTLCVWSPQHKGCCSPHLLLSGCSTFWHRHCFNGLKPQKTNCLAELTAKWLRYEQHQTKDFKKLSIYGCRIERASNYPDLRSFCTCLHYTERAVSWDIGIYVFRSKFMLWMNYNIDFAASSNGSRQMFSQYLKHRGSSWICPSCQMLSRC